MRNILVISDEAREIAALFKSNNKKGPKQKGISVGIDMVNPLKYEIVFLDLDINGWQKKLLDFRQRMPVIAFSTKGLFLEALSIGIDYNIYIKKGRQAHMHQNLLNAEFASV